MNTCSLLRGIAVACTVLSIAVCAQGAPSSAASGNANASNPPASAKATPTKGQVWANNGASACEKYLTPDVVAAILSNPAGHSHRLDAQSCEYQTDHSGSIEISLKVADIDLFRQELPRIALAHPMAGVGDGAYWNEAGAVSAVKGHDRGCDISVVGIPQQMKIHNAELGQKLGEICNKLFALP